MFSDTTSAIQEFMLQEKPIVTFKHHVPKPHLINITNAIEIESAILKALTYPNKIMDCIKSYNLELHPYFDGESSKRVLDASISFLHKDKSYFKSKPINLMRKYKLRKQLNHFTLTSYNRPFTLEKITQTKNCIKISAVIITFNEEEHLEKCLASLVEIADEIVVVDSFSTDGTKEICKTFNVKFIEHEFNGYIEQKNYAISTATHDYILSLDGDEALSEELKNSILRVKQNWISDGYYSNRLNNYCGQWIKHSDWYPDKKLRLFKKGSGEWKGINPHDSYTLKKNIKSEKLKGDLLHWIYRDYDEHKQKVENFSTIAAAAYYKLGIKSSVFKILFRPTWAFFKAYFLRLGFLDGKNGYRICIQTFNVTYLKYRKLYIHWQNQ
jgi:glycosyltransferase involved in cell wall biosynthesis